MKREPAIRVLMCVEGSGISLVSRAMLFVAEFLAV